MAAVRLELQSASRDDCRALADEIRSLTASPQGLRDTVSEVVAAVRERGDAAVREYAQRFDGPRAPAEPRVTPEQLAAAAAALDPELRESLETAIANVAAVAEAELASTRDTSVTLEQGQTVELHDHAVAAAGVYAPGGRAAYPSTVVMCCVPARVAGVQRIAVTTPPATDGSANPLVLAACALCKVDEVQAIGGAQAIAALACGTESIEPVDLVVGPGNAYVQEAKRQLFGAVGIDSIAGPSELVVVTDETSDPAVVALDLAAQTEHGDGGLVVAVSPSARLLDDVQGELPDDTTVLLVRVPDIDAALALSDRIAPEHLELQVADAERLAGSAPTAGCVFVGRYGATAFGDYVAGSNHVLPTGGAARFAGPLGVTTFRRRQALVSLTAEAAQALAPHVGRIARAEGFPIHAQSAEARAQEQS